MNGTVLPYLSRFIHWNFCLPVSLASRSPAAECRVNGGSSSRGLNGPSGLVICLGIWHRVSRTSHRRVTGVFDRDNAWRERFMSHRSSALYSANSRVFVPGDGVSEGSASDIQSPAPRTAERSRAFPPRETPIQGVPIQDRLLHFNPEECHWGIHHNPTFGAFLIHRTGPGRFGTVNLLIPCYNR